MKKYRIGIIIFAVIACLAAEYIFFNSSQPQAVSNERSTHLTEQIKPILDPYDKIPKRDFNNSLRKVAHGVEFFILGGSLAGIAYCLGKIKKRRYICFPLLLGLLVAVTDEYLQFYTKRGSQVSDVLIDFAGILIGYLIITSVFFLINFIKRKRVAKAERR